MPHGFHNVRLRQLVKRAAATFRVGDWALNRIDPDGLRYVGLGSVVAHGQRELLTIPGGVHLGDGRVGRVEVFDRSAARRPSQSTAGTSLPCEGKSPRSPAATLPLPVRPWVLAFLVAP